MNEADSYHIRLGIYYVPVLYLNQNRTSVDLYKDIQYPSTRPPPVYCCTASHPNNNSKPCAIFIHDHFKQALLLFLSSPLIKPSIQLYTRKLARHTLLYCSQETHPLHVPPQNILLLLRPRLLLLILPASIPSLTTARLCHVRAYSFRHPHFPTLPRAKLIHSTTHSVINQREGQQT